MNTISVSVGKLVYEITFNRYHHIKTNADSYWFTNINSTQFESNVFKFYYLIVENKYNLNQLKVLLDNIVDLDNSHNYHIYDGFSSYNIGNHKIERLFIGYLLDFVWTKIRELNLRIRCYKSIASSFAESLPAKFIHFVYREHNKENDNILKEHMDTSNPNKEDIIIAFQKQNIELDISYLTNFIHKVEDARIVLKNLKIKDTNSKKESKERVTQRLNELFDKFQKEVGGRNFSLRKIPIEIHSHITSYMGI